jgi:hypothetical protein
MFYTAYAIVRGDRGTTQSLYIQEWFENTHDATEAYVMEVTGDIADIDFSMDKREPRDNGFSGQCLSDSSGNGVPSKVTAYWIKLDPNSNEPSKIHSISVVTDDNGNYTFTDLEPGSYLVFGTPGDRPYVPGWYVADNVAATSWKDATVIEVGDVVLDGSHDIRYVNAKQGVGKGRVRGWCYDRKGGIVRKEDAHVENVDGIMGSLIIATDSQGEIVDFAMSANEGAYELLNLGFGTWRVSADRIGYTPSTENVTLDDNNLDVSLSIGLIKVVSSVEVPVDLVGTSYQLFPNPTNGSATLSFPSEIGTAQISFVSAAGVVLGTQNVDVVSGTSTVLVNTSTFPMGMVMVRVQNGAHTFALPLQIIR